jgi:hypothetical protein
MRRATSRTISALALISVLISLGFVLAYPAYGEDSCGEQTYSHRYTVFFRKDSSDGLWGGRFQAHNDAVLTRILRLRRLWPDIDAVRFLFVARRSPTCAADKNCNPHRLLFERFRAISRKMAELAEQTAGPAPRLAIDIAFADELGQRLSLASMPAEADGVVLRLKPEQSEMPSDGCFGRIQVWDPALPRTIGAPPERPVLPVPADQPVQFGQCAKLRLDPRWRDAVSAFWGNGSGAYRQAEPGLLSGRVVPLPDDRQTLYLLSRLRLSAPAWRRFYSRLSPSFRRPETLPPSLRFLQGRGQSKDIGDHGEFLQGTPVTRERPTTEEGLKICYYMFSPRIIR